MKSTVELIADLLNEAKTLFPQKQVSLVLDDKGVPSLHLYCSLTDTEESIGEWWVIGIDDKLDWNNINRDLVQAKQHIIQTILNRSRKPNEPKVG